MSALTVTGPAAAFSVRDAPGPVVMTAIHAGHELRPELADLVLVDASIRLREEDPFTDRLAVAGTRVTVHRSRFEVDLNRPRARPSTAHLRTRGASRCGSSHRHPRWWSGRWPSMTRSTPCSRTG